MDEFERTLKRDAEDIRAGVSPELKARIDASLRATKRIEPVPDSRTPGISLWWASSLTGLAAAIIVLVVINWNRPTTETVPPEQVADRTVPAPVDELQGLTPPRFIKTADFAAPLEEELARLQADIERARANVKEDIDFTF